MLNGLLHADRLLSAVTVCQLRQLQEPIRLRESLRLDLLWSSGWMFHSLHVKRPCNDSLCSCYGALEIVGAITIYDYYKASRMVWIYAACF